MSFPPGTVGAALQDAVALTSRERQLRAEGAAAEREKVRKLAEAKSEQLYRWSEQPSGALGEFAKEDDRSRATGLRYQADALRDFAATLEKP